MDSHQIPSNTKKRSQKNRKTQSSVEADVELSVKSIPYPVSKSFSCGLHEGGNPQLQAQINDDKSSKVSVEPTEGSSSKRKRIRKKKTKKLCVQGSEVCTSFQNESQSKTIESISASFPPAVAEVVNSLESSKGHMNFPAISTSKYPKSTNSSQKSSVKKVTAHCGVEVEKIISPGAQKLTSELHSSNLSEELIDRKTTRQVIVVQKTELGSQDLDILSSASRIGPIYSHPSLCTSVTVTSSSSSNQLCSDRIQSLHLYGNILQSTASEVPVPMSSTNKMSAPPSVPQSREAIEAERKARKAAKAAAKCKGKTVVDGTCKSDKGVEQCAVPINTVHEIPNAQASTSSSCSPRKSESVGALADKVKNINISGSSKTFQAKGVDEPDLAALPNQIKVETVGITKKSIPDIHAETKTEFRPAVVNTAEIAKKSGAELRAERRAKQEAQRAAKAEQQLDKRKAQNQQQLKSQPAIKPNNISLPEKTDNKPSPPKYMKEVKDAKAERRVKLFSHLHQNSFKTISRTVGVSHPQYHSSIVSLGVQYAHRVVLGSNARCLALLYALKEVVKDYETPPQKEFSRGLEAYLQPNMDFLQQCRPHSVSMVNALRYIKWQLTQLSIGDSDEKAKQHILDAIEQYIDDQIGKAAEAIGKVVKDKIDDNDVILVFACSSLVLSALKVALKEGRKFHVIVVDTLPWLEGREMLRRLVTMNVQCSYVHLSAASFVMRQVSKVLLGAHALLANGYVMSRAGSSQIALMAHAYNVPVLVCCETHKFSERVQTDSFVYNELADPDELIGSRRAGEREEERERPLANWRNIPSLSLLNLVYDVTPPDLVTAVVTERAILPCTSVPVILRIKPTEC